jgi:LacI family transcriptional regulator, galactose operon repressor
MSDVDTNPPRGAARVTISQVASLAGVSPTTVSHVLSGNRIVGAATRATVEDAVRKLGYRPNIVARNLRTRRSHMIAVIVPDITNPFYSVLIRGLADAADGADYGTYVCNTDGLLDREQKFIEDVLDRGVDGVVMASVNVAPDDVFNPARFGTPVVSLGERIDDPKTDTVAADDEGGSHAATLHLVSRGALRVAMISGPPGAGEARVRGYRRALDETSRPVDPALIEPGDWTRTGGQNAMRSLMVRQPRPDAVFCANDLTAIGAMDTARELGLTIPGDVALVGFDDVDAAALVRPALTTVRNPSYDTGRRAGELLLSRMLGRYEDTARTIMLPCPLVRRESA